MQFRIEKKPNENLLKYPTDDLKTAQLFTKKLQNELQDFLKGVILFGSSARKEATEMSDIDVLVVTNDLDFKMTKELVETYRIIIENLIAKTSNRLHVTSMTLSSFWDYSRAGDPVAMNIIRDGVALYDNGFFQPMQMLLKDGRVRPSEESVWRYFSRAPKTLTNSRWHLLQATLDLYWAVIDAAHAALMKQQQIPPSPDHVADLLEKVFVKNRELEPKYVETMKRFYNLSKMITHREVQEITGQEYETYFKEAVAFVNRMKKIIYK